MTVNPYVDNYTKTLNN